MFTTFAVLPGAGSVTVPTMFLFSIAVSAALILTIIILNVLRRLISFSALPTSLHWAGVDTPRSQAQKLSSFRRHLAILRANLSSILDAKALLLSGHRHYSANDVPYVLPSPLTGPEVVLPPSQIRWLAEQPDSVLSQQDVNRRFLEADFTFLHGNIVREPVHPGVIRKELSKGTLFKLNGEIADELTRALSENWGESEEWKEVKIYDSMLDVISRLSVRVFLGEQFCRNKEFLDAARNFDRNVVLKASALNLLPEFLKPVFAPFITIHDKLHYWTIAKHIMPLIHERLSHTDASKIHPHTDDQKLPFFTPSSPSSASKTDDYIDWAIAHAQAHPDPAELTPSLISRRLACLCFAAIQSSLITITNAIFDIASSPDSLAIQASLRTEVESEISSQAHNAQCAWSKASLARMTHVDSTLRESMRLNGFVARGIMKTVMAKDGVVLPGGERVPKGVKVGVQAWSVHRDESVYHGADRFAPFRFVPRKEFSENGSDDENAKEATRGKREQPQALVTTSPTFMAFSHGPNACPGRFFAANQLKLTLAHIALLYDIEPIAERPGTKWFFGSMAAPMWETLRVRRRKAV